MTTLSLLKQLVQINSVFPLEKEISVFLAKYLRQLGFQVQTVLTGKDRPNIVATFGKAKKYIGFYGHIDTVPPEASVKDPYHVIIKGEKARGLGTEDMKGGIAVILQTAAYAVENNYPVKVIFGVDEENISEGAHDLVTSGLLADVAFLIVGESGQVVDTSKPFSVVFGRKGRILLEAVIHGKKTHAAESHKGSNAIEKAAVFLAWLQKLKVTAHTRLGKTQIIPQSIHAETDSFSIPDTCVVRFSVLTTPGITLQLVLSTIQKMMKKERIEGTVMTVERATPYGESYEVDRKHPFVKRLQNEVFAPAKVTPIYTTSVADENVFANRLHIPTVALGPIGGGGHTKDEWLDLTSLAVVEQTYKNILKMYTEK